MYGPRGEGLLALSLFFRGRRRKKEEDKRKEQVVEGEEKRQRENERAEGRRSSPASLGTP